MAFTNISDKNVKILKYNFINKATTVTNFEYGFPIKIKYYYDEIQNKEYLVLQFKREIIIYLIKDNDEYELIYCKGEKKYFDDCDIIYNQYMKENLLIISYFYYEWSGSRRGRAIKIFKLLNKKVFEINCYYVYNSGTSCRREKLFLIWEDKISQKFYLISSNYYSLKFMEISDNNNEYEYKFNCCVYRYNNCDYIF